MSVRRRVVQRITPEALERRRGHYREHGGANVCSTPTCEREPSFVARWEQDSRISPDPVHQFRALCEEHAASYAEKHDISIKSATEEQAWVS